MKEANGTKNDVALELKAVNFGWHKIYGKLSTFGPQNTKNGSGFSINIKNAKFDGFTFYFLKS